MNHMADIGLMHLAHRAGFGLPLTSNFTKETYLKTLLEKAKEGQINEIKVIDDQAIRRFRQLMDEQENNSDKVKFNRQIILLSQKCQIALRLAWLREMVQSENQLIEKMALFWHNHFATSDKRNPIANEQLLDVLRQNALGNFGTLLRQVSKTSVMMRYLNNQQNTKKSPNENFAREVMELFTLGRDNGYTEQDIKEAARAFTGWKVNRRTGVFFEQKGQMDQGEKTIFGKTGNFSGDDVFDMLLENKQTARHICEKIYRYFVNPLVDEKRVEDLSDLMYKNNYEILPVLEAVFTSDWFYDTKNVGSQIKSPIEMLAGLYRQLGHEEEDLSPILYYSRLLSQQLFDLPNVGGWPHHKDWIDASSLMLRLQIPSAIISAEQIDIAAKTDDDATGGNEELEMMNEEVPFERLKRAAENRVKKAKLHIDEPMLESIASEKDFTASISERLLCVNLKSDVLQQIKSSEDQRLATLKRILSTPEYQIC